MKQLLGSSLPSYVGSTAYQKNSSEWLKETRAFLKIKYFFARADIVPHDGTKLPRLQPTGFNPLLGGQGVSRG
jgi:hypothetical protein